MKILSIIVPAYNMEDYLERCLNSVLHHKWDEDLEVIVVNDGSKDRTLQIALTYKDKFPEIVTVIDKENGNHGSAMNAGLRVAKGKYVKELDADDWFDTKEFERFIEQLKNVDCDLVITHYTTCYASGWKRQRFFSPDKYNKIYDFSILLSYPKLMPPPMHAVTHKTELLHQMNYKQTEGIFYTDTEWIFYPMVFIEKIVFINTNVYQYYVGREGQTVDPNIRKRNISHVLIGVEKMMSYYTSYNEKVELSEYRKNYLWNIIKKRFSGLYLFYLLLQSNKDFNPAEIGKLDESIKLKSIALYSELEEIRLHKLIPFRYIHYWRLYSKRIPQIWRIYATIRYLKDVYILIRSLFKKKYL
jgi:glycosyltransferase involved in cell wall biosynthesis